MRKNTAPGGPGKGYGGDKKSSGGRGPKPFGNSDRSFKKSTDSRGRKPYRAASDEEGYEKRSGGEKRPYGKRDGDSRPYLGDRDNKRPFGKSDRFDKGDDRGKRPYGKRDGDSRPYSGDRDNKRSFGKSDRFDKDDGGEKRPYNKRDGGGRSYSGDRDHKRSFGKPDRFNREDGEEKRSYGKRDDKRPYSGDRDESRSFDKPRYSKRDDKRGGDRPFEDRPKRGGYGKRDDRPERPYEKKNFDKSPRLKGMQSGEGDSRKRYKRKFEEEEEVHEEQMPLNKYIAHSGLCSRRDAADLIKQGKVKVNGELVTEPGYKVQEEDKVTLAGKKLTPQKDKVYILLNKPKGFITTTDDPEGRKTVMDLVANSGVERLFPVGRLDRNTTGLLLLTNDGDLTQKLSHPSYNIKKIYHVTLDEPLTKKDFEKVLEGVELEDGMAHVDSLSYLENKNELGLEIHSGRNRIVRRIFEALEYEVVKLDRVMYAGLTKKNLPRSKWRFLTDREIVLLKHFKS